jgi:hypothetical protein
VEDFGILKGLLEDQGVVANFICVSLYLFLFATCSPYALHCSHRPPRPVAAVITPNKRPNVNDCGRGQGEWVPLASFSCFIQGSHLLIIIIIIMSKFYATSFHGPHNTLKWLRPTTCA